jgi:septum formation protein
MNVPTTLVLASASPARLRTLRAAGLDPEVMVSGVDESIVESNRPESLCATLARMKAEAVASQLARPEFDTFVLGCDSVLGFDGQVLGKPANAADAIERWQQMRGDSGILYTGHCLIDVTGGRRAEAVTQTIVYFSDITDQEIAEYVATGEPLEAAGAFTIDGLGSWFVDRIDGDHGTVIGVSLPALRRLLSELGTSVSALTAAALPSRS